MKFIYLEWIDSGGWKGWTDISHADDPPLKIVSCGVFIKETRETVVIASSFCGENETADGMISIPKVAITKRKWVKA